MKKNYSKKVTGPDHPPQDPAKSPVDSSYNPTDKEVQEYQKLTGLSAQDSKKELKTRFQLNKKGT